MRKENNLQDGIKLYKRKAMIKTSFLNDSRQASFNKSNKKPWTRKRIWPTLKPNHNTNSTWDQSASNHWGVGKGQTGLTSVQPPHCIIRSAWKTSNASVYHHRKHMNQLRWNKVEDLTAKSMLKVNERAMSRSQHNQIPQPSPDIIRERDTNNYDTIK